MGCDTHPTARRPSSGQALSGESPTSRPRCEATLDDEESSCSRRAGGAYDRERFVRACTAASSSSPSTTSSSFSATVARSVLLPVSGSVK
jgi:hypothetical protein